MFPYPRSYRGFQRNNYSVQVVAAGLGPSSTSFLNFIAKSKPPKKSPAVSKKIHSEAERRRRQRINAHLDTLRALLPPSPTRADKATLLDQVVRRVKDLRKRASEAAEMAEMEDGRAGGAAAASWRFPGDTDELTLSYCEGGGNGGAAAARMMKATVCCEDRSGLVRDLNRAIRSAGARAVRVEMAAVGGRCKSVVVLQGGGAEEADEFGKLRRALKAAVENRVSGSGFGFSQSMRGVNALTRFDGSMKDAGYYPLT